MLNQLHQQAKFEVERELFFITDNLKLINITHELNIETQFHSQNCLCCACRLSRVRDIESHSAASTYSVVLVCHCPVRHPHHSLLQVFVCEQMAQAEVSVGKRVTPANIVIPLHAKNILQLLTLSNLKMTSFVWCTASNLQIWIFIYMELESKPELKLSI